MDLQLPRRLDKFLADAGIGSKSQIEQIAAAGAVTRNGGVYMDLHRIVDPQRDQAEVAGVAAQLVAPSIYALLHKPKGVLTTLSDPNDRRCVAALLPGEWRGRVGVVGRLDRPTTGALLVTNDGDLNNLLTDPATHVWKRYILTVVGEPDERDPRLERIRQGIELSGVRTKPARCGVVAETGRTDGDGGRLREVWIEISEGRFHQVRRMANQVQLKFVHLHRAAIGPLELGDLAPGQWRPLRADEVDALYAAAGGRDVPKVRAQAALRRRLDAGELDAQDAALVRRYFDSLSGAGV